MAQVSLASTILLMIITGTGAFFIGYKIRHWLKLRTEYEKQLEEQLHKTKTDYKSYKQDVNRHFETTASSFNNMLQQSRELYNHLVDSYDNLIVKHDSDKKQLTDESIINKADNKLSHNKSSADVWPKISISSNNSSMNQSDWHPTYTEVKKAHDIEKDDSELINNQQGIELKDQIDSDSKFKKTKNTKHPELKVIKTPESESTV